MPGCAAAATSSIMAVSAPRLTVDERCGDVEGVASFQKHPWSMSESSALRFYVDFSDFGYIGMRSFASWRSIAGARPGPSRVLPLRFLCICVDYGRPGIFHAKPHFILITLSDLQPLRLAWHSYFQCSWTPWTIIFLFVLVVLKDWKEVLCTPGCTRATHPNRVERACKRL